MEFLKICGGAAICCAAVALFAAREKELTTLISTLIYIIVMLYVISRAGELLTMLQTYFNMENVPTYVPLLLKAVGIALIGGVASSVCEGAGQKGASRAIDLLTVLEILYIAIPIVKELLEKTRNILGG